MLCIFFGWKLFTRKKTSTENIDSKEGFTGGYFFTSSLWHKTKTKGVWLHCVTKHWSDCKFGKKWFAALDSTYCYCMLVFHFLQMAVRVNPVGFGDIRCLVGLKIEMCLCRRVSWKNFWWRPRFCSKRFLRKKMGTRHCPWRRFLWVSTGSFKKIFVGKPVPIGSGMDRGFRRIHSNCLRRTVNAPLLCAFCFSFCTSSSIFFLASSSSRPHIAGNTPTKGNSKQKTHEQQPENTETQEPESRSHTKQFNQYIGFWWSRTFIFLHPCQPSGSIPLIYQVHSLFIGGLWIIATITGTRNLCLLTPVSLSQFALVYSWNLPVLYSDIFETTNAQKGKRMKKHGQTDPSLPNRFSVQFNWKLQQHLQQLLFTEKNSRGIVG